MESAKMNQLTIRELEGLERRIDELDALAEASDDYGVCDQVHRELIEIQNRIESSLYVSRRAHLTLVSKE